MSKRRDSNFSSSEIWKPIKSYEGAYEVSTLGRVRSVNRDIVRGNGRTQTVKERILKPRKSEYYNIKLRKNGVERVFYIHELVAAAFLEHSKESKLVVDHIDENKYNNIHTNLQIITRSENLKRSVTDDLRQRKRVIALNKKRLNGTFIKA